MTDANSPLDTSRLPSAQPLARVIDFPDDVVERIKPFADADDMTWREWILREVELSLVWAEWASEDER